MGVFVVMAELLFQEERSTDEDVDNDSDSPSVPAVQDGSDLSRTTSRRRRCCESVLGIFNPRKHAYRYLLLGLFCVARICLTYNVDLPAALESTIINVMRVDITQYELLYSLYSWPSVFLAVIGGLLIDRVFGLRLGLTLFVTTACLGQLLVAMGAYIDQFWLMVVGRFVLGAGAELASSAGDVFAASLFRDRELSFVFGLVYGAGRVSSTLTLNFSSVLYSFFKSYIENHNARLGSVMLFGFVLALASLMVAIIAALLDYRREKVTGTNTQNRRQFKLKDIKDFSLPFWIFVLIGLLYYIPVSPFISIGQVFFKQKYAYLTDVANLVNGVTFLVLAVAYPLFGLVFDWTGYKLYWGMFSILGTQACHILFAFSGPDFFAPITGSLSLGLFYSMYTSAVWPLVFLLIQEHQLGTAYEISYAFYTLGQDLAAVIIGQIIDNNGYMIVELFFVGVLSLTLILLIALYITPKGQSLNISGRRRRMLTKAKEQVKAAVEHPDGIVDSDVTLQTSAMVKKDHHYEC